jgi:hypothetical protein
MHALAALSVALLAALLPRDVGAIQGGVEVAADDPGARASVIVTARGGSCSGLVYGDRFIVTAAHCLIDKDFKPTMAPQDVTITYAHSLHQPDAATRKAAALLVHENFPRQVADFLAATGDLPFADYPINHEDIALIRVDGVHPAGALSAALPEINNDYVFCCIPHLRSGPLVWADVYGFGAAPRGETLHKLRASAVTPDIVRPGKDPDLGQFYIPRQIAFHPDAPPAAGGPARGICHGDSGGPAFFVATTRTHDAPTGALKLVRGQPLAIGLATRVLPPHAEPGQPEPEPPACTGSFVLVRLDYYRDWILSRIKQMQ